MGDATLVARMAGKEARRWLPSPGVTYQASPWAPGVITIPPHRDTTVLWYGGQGVQLLFCPATQPAQAAR